MGMFSGVRKQMAILSVPFCDVSDIYIYPKYPKIYLKHNKSQSNDCFDLKNGMIYSLG